VLLFCFSKASHGAGPVSFLLDTAIINVLKKSSILAVCKIVWGIAGGAARSARTSDKDSAASDVNAEAASAAAAITTQSPDDGRVQRLAPAQCNGGDAELTEICFQGSEQQLIVLHSFIHHWRIISNVSAAAGHNFTSLKDPLTTFVVLQ
jgi:hypothetical protein